MAGDNPNGWHLDKRVPVAIILVLIGQIFGFGYIYASLETRVAHLEGGLREQVYAMRQVPERLAGIEATLLAIKERLDRFPRN
jgi:hypothetical protein